MTPKYLHQAVAEKIVFDLPDTELILYDNFFTKEESDHYYTTLLTTTPWQEYAMEFYNKTVTVPRMISWYEDRDNLGAEETKPDWTPELLSIRGKWKKKHRLNSIVFY